MTVPPQLPSLVQRMGSRALSAAVGRKNGRVSNWIVRHNCGKKDSVATVQSVLRRSFATTKDRLASLQASGLIDDDGLTNFTTLHELQLSACQVFADNNIFGTYTKKAPQEGDKGEPGGAFEWMTYQEFSALVDKTRSVLKDIGTL